MGIREDENQKQSKQEGYRKDCFQGARDRIQQEGNQGNKEAEEGTL